VNIPFTMIPFRKTKNWCNHDKRKFYPLLIYINDNIKCPSWCSNQAPMVIIYMHSSAPTQWLKVFVWTSYHGYLLVPSYDQRLKIYSTYMVSVTNALGEIIPLKNFELCSKTKCAHDDKFVFLILNLFIYDV
jgi:hypothetical protein